MTLGLGVAGGAAWLVARYRRDQLVAEAGAVAHPAHHPTPAEEAAKHEGGAETPAEETRDAEPGAQTGQNGSPADPAA